MSDSTLFPRAFVRGLNSELIRSGAVHYPSKLAADQAADYVADIAGIPDPVTQGDQLTLKIAADVCVMLAKASDALCKDAGGYQPELAKTASAQNPYDLAASECIELMQKVALENETPNTAEEAALHEATARLDISQRPPGYAHTGPGGAMPQGEGEIGSERSVGEGDAKMAMQRAIHNLRTAAVATGNTGAPNTLAAAAKVDDFAALEKKNRPEGYAHKRPSFEVPSGAVIGQEQKVAMDRFQKTAALVLPYLSESFTEREKVAHVQAMMNLSPRGKAKYLNEMYVAYGADKTASLNYANAFYKVAEDAEEEAEELEVARAIEQAAENLEDRAEAHTEDHAEEVMGEKEAAVAKLAQAAARIASR